MPLNAMTGFDPEKHVLFTQFVRPYGIRRPTWVERPPDIIVKAKAVVEKGGKFEIEELGTGTVSLTVEHYQYEDGPVAIELCPNGQQILYATDRLIETAYRRLIGAAGRKQEPKNEAL